MRFSQAYSGAPACAPARCVLLTGRAAPFAQIRGNKEMSPEGQAPLTAETRTLGHALQEQGFATAAIGKWGLGPPGSSGAPNRQGFDHFFGYNCQREAHPYFPDHLWRNAERIELNPLPSQDRVVVESNSVSGGALRMRVRRDDQRPR